MNTLELRKQMLIAESDLNRMHLVDELGELTETISVVGTRARSYTTLATSAAVLMTGFAAYRQTSNLCRPKHPWLGRLLKGAELAGSLWLAFRSKPT